MSREPSEAGSLIARRSMLATFLHSRIHLPTRSSAGSASGAKAPFHIALYGTAEAVPFQSNWHLFGTSRVGRFLG